MTQAFVKHRSSPVSTLNSLCRRWCKNTFITTVGSSQNGAYFISSAARLSTDIRCSFSHSGVNAHHLVLLKDFSAQFVNRSALQQKKHICELQHLTQPSGYSWHGKTWKINTRCSLLIPNQGSDSALPKHGHQACRSHSAPSPLQLDWFHGMEGRMTKSGSTYPLKHTLIRTYDLYTCICTWN